MKKLFAVAMIFAGLGLAPAALAAGGEPYQNTGSASAALQGYTTSGPNLAQAATSTMTPNPYQNTGSASAALQGYTTSGNGGTPVAIVATGGDSFNWVDAGIGAAGAFGATLILIGVSLVVLRRRSRLAV